MNEIVFYDYWRSSASYRVRIALNLFNLKYRTEPVDLLAHEQKTKTYLAKNPQGIVPTLEIDGVTFTQSIAIIEYLSDLYPERALIPQEAVGRARVRAMSYAIAMEIHPICNTSVVSHVARITDDGDEAKLQWMQRFISTGLASFESLLDCGSSGKFCHENRPGIADCCLIPQLYNARRWGVDYSSHTKICAIEKACHAINAFRRALPENCQPQSI